MCLVALYAGLEEVEDFLLRSEAGAVADRQRAREVLLEVGMSDYVSKPIVPELLAEALRRQCEASDVL